jgi:hypothetical protein
MPTSQPTASDIRANEKIDASIALLAEKTTYAQYAKAFKDLWSVCLNKRVSEDVRMRALNEHFQAMVRGTCWFAPPLSDFWPEDRTRGHAMDYMAAWIRRELAVDEGDRDRFLLSLCFCCGLTRMTRS